MHSTQHSTRSVTWEFHPLVEWTSECAVRDTVSTVPGRPCNNIIVATCISHHLTSVCMQSQFLVQFFVRVLLIKAHGQKSVATIHVRHLIHL